MGSRPRLRRAARPGPPPADASLPPPPRLAASLPLGPPLPVHPLRRPAAEAPDRAHRRPLLRHRAHRVRRRRLHAPDNALSRDAPGGTMFELKLLTKVAVPKALERAERYRFLNEPGEAESICRATTTPRCAGTPARGSS